MLLRRACISHRETQVKQLIAQYEHLLIAYICGTKSEKESLFYDIVPQRKLDSSVLLAQIILIKKNMKGQEAIALRDLYEKLGYDKVSFKKMFSSSWIKRCEGLQELTCMEALTDAPIFDALMNDKHAFVRIAALKAVIAHGKHWQKALRQYKYPLSRWEQVQICETINANKTIGFTDCQPLLRSQNQTVVALVGLCGQLFTQINPQELLSIRVTPVTTSFTEKELVTDF